MKTPLYALITEHDIPNVPGAIWWGDTDPIALTIQEIMIGTLINGGSDGPTGHVVRFLGSQSECRNVYDDINNEGFTWDEWLASWKESKNKRDGT